MDNQKKTSREYYIVDLKHIFETLWKRIWMIVVVTLLTAALGCGLAAFVIAPQYSSQIMLYVNNSSLSIGGTSVSISASQISAAQSLVKTYIVILNNRTTLETVIEKAGVPYTYEQLSKMIEADSVNNTEIMRVTVTTGDPYESANIANTIAEVFPDRIAEIITGSSMEVVDAGVPDLNKVSPSLTRYTLIGFLLGLLISVGAVVVMALMDDTIHSEDYIVETYSYPLLAVVPDLESAGSDGRAYYAAKRKGNGGNRL